jgi:hypothetical protein
LLGEKILFFVFYFRHETQDQRLLAIEAGNRGFLNESKRQPTRR